jgi:hypothetical protein
MSEEKDLTILLKSMQPKLQDGDFVFCTVANKDSIHEKEMIMSFREEEGLTIIVRKDFADSLALHYSFVAAWITLTVHSSLEAVGLTAAFAAALTKHEISCNVVAAFYHDHIFVKKTDAEKAMEVLWQLTGV